MNGFSPDGYIIDQDYFDEYEYRTMHANINGCGWIAAYNIRHFLRHGIGFESVLNEMDLMHTLRIPGPTTMQVSPVSCLRALCKAPVTGGTTEERISPSKP